MLPRSQRSNRGRNVPFYVRHRLTTAFLTRSRRSQARKPRAARICGPVITATADEPEAVALDFICPLPPDGTARASSAGRGVPRPPPAVLRLSLTKPRVGTPSKRRPVEKVMLAGENLTLCLASLGIRLRSLAQGGELCARLGHVVAELR
jgi:hypothetical protein